MNNDNIQILDTFNKKENKWTVLGAWQDGDTRKYFIADHYMVEDMLSNHQFYFDQKEAYEDFIKEEKQATSNYKI